MRLSTKINVAVEGWEVGEFLAPEIEVPEVLEEEVTNALATLDKVDANPNDGNLDMNLASRVPTRGKLRLIRPLTGETLDIDVALELAIMD
jgi:hypothetical protein